MTHLTKLIVSAIGSIPEGKVASYGQIAEVVSHRGGARQVSWTLRTQTKKYGLPWHRVINSKGAISLKNEDGQHQRELLEAEGVEVDSHLRIDMRLYGWKPIPPEIDMIERKAASIAED